MARTATPIHIPEDPINPAAVARIDADVVALAALDTEQKRATHALARQLNYGGSTDPDVLENSARDAIRRIGAGIFELGGYLLLLKSACDHGKFLPTLERLGIGISAAGRYMAVTRRFANSATSRNLESLAMSKLVELLPLDDEQIGDLTELGQTGELTLDDVARMSVKELRAAVRDARADLDAAQQRIGAKNARIDTLERAQQRIESAPPEERIAAGMEELTRRGLTAMSYVRGGLRLAFEHMFDLERAGEAPSGAHRKVMAGWVRELENELLVLRGDFFLDEVAPANVRADLDALVAQRIAEDEAADAARAADAA